jgi:hypothetical protein
MNFIGQALLGGYSNNQILRFLSNNYPLMKKFIGEATSQGHTEEEITKFIDNAMSSPLTSSTKISEYGIRNLKEKLRTEQIKRYGKAALNLAIPVAGMTIGRFMSQAQNIAPTTPPKPMPSGGMPPTPPQPMPSGGLPPMPQGSNIPQNLPPIPPQGGLPPQGGPIAPSGMQPPTPPIGGPQEPAKQPSDLSIEGLRKQFAESPAAKEEGKILTAAKKMLAKPEMTANMTKEQVKSIFTLNDEEADAVLRIFHDQTKGLYLKPEQAIQAPTKQQEPALESQVAKEVPRVSREALKQFEGPEMEFPKLDISKIKKGDEVITPNNQIGNIEAFSGSGVLVNVDGKIKKLKVDELEGTPDFIKSAKIVIDPSQVEEAAKSAALGTVLESPDKTKLSISFGPSGEFYTYRRKDGKPIDEDILNRIKEGMTMPISTGDAFLGSWDSGIADSRGTVAINDIVKFAQKEGEPDDPNKPLVYYKENTSYIHPYIKEMLNALMGLSKQYEKSKRKPKKPKAKNKP